MYDAGPKISQLLLTVVGQRGAPEISIILAILSVRVRKMVAAGTRKGFKFVSASKPVVTEKLSFDEVEKEGTTTPGASRKRAATKAAEAKAAKARKTTTASSSSSSARGVGQKSSSSPMRRGSVAAKADVTTAAQGDGRKAHYPTIDMNMTKIANLMKGASKSHAELLDRIVVEVCEAEKAGLEAFFHSSTGTSRSREAIHDILLRVLDDIPTAVTSTCPEDAEFSPEFVSGEKSGTASLLSALEELRQHSANLAAYEKNINSLAKDHGMWLQGPSKEAIEAFNSNANAGTDEDTAAGMDESSVASTEASYQDVLHGVAQSCSTILARTTEFMATEAQAARAQERLYTNYNRLRLGAGPAGVALPAASTKALIKGLAKR